jgi:beta-phosphoglucomutase
MDGVIVDTAKFHFLAWKRLADTLSIDFTEEQNEQLKGVSRVDSLEKILSWGHLVLDNNKKIELMELKNKWYLEYVEGVSPEDMLPGAHNLLLDIHKNGLKIGLGSSSKKFHPDTGKNGHYSFVFYYHRRNQNSLLQATS